MSILNTELILFNSANMPQDDVSTTGGAIDATGRPDLVQFSATANAFVVSDGADVRTGVLTYRTPAGVKTTVNFTLTGAVEVDTGVSCERILRLLLNTTSGTRTVSLKQGTGGTVRATVRPNEVMSTAMFIDAASSPSGSTARSEKAHFKSITSALALTNATVTLTADPLSRITIALEASKGGSSSIANRLAATGLTFVDDNVAQAVPTNNLAAGENIGTWAKQTLPQDDPAAKSTFTLQLAGSSI